MSSDNVWKKLLCILKKNLKVRDKIKLNVKCIMDGTVLKKHGKTQNVTGQKAKTP